MQRARVLFERTGLEAIVFQVDIQVSDDCRFGFTSLVSGAGPWNSSRSESLARTV